MPHWRRPVLGVTLAIALVVVGGCANYQYQRTLTSWKGAPLQELVDAWGPSHEQFRNEQGHMVYQWSYREIGIGDTSASFQYKTGRQKRSPFCQTRFTVDDRNIIQKWAYRGDDCSGTPRS